MDQRQPPDDFTARDGFAPVPGAALYYREIGQGPPCIVLHGGPGFDHKYLLPDLDRLADKYRLIYYDQRGRGRSGANVRPSDVSIQSEIDDLEGLRAYLGLEQIALVGHSWGGLLAMEYALRMAQRVSRLILLNTGPASHGDCVLFEQERDAKAPADAELLRALRLRRGHAEGDLATRSMYYRVYFRATLRPPELLDRLCEHLQVGWTKADVLKARAIGQRLWSETYGTPTYDLLPQLAHLPMPTLVLHGDYDFIPLTCVSHIADAIPGSRLVVIPDCGHFSYLERPDAVRHALADFFQTS